MSAVTALSLHTEEVPPLTFRERCSLVGHLLLVLCFGIAILPGCLFFWLAEVSECGIQKIRPAQPNWQTYRTTCVMMGRMSNPLAYLWLLLCAGILIALLRLCHIGVTALAQASFVPITGIVETIDACKGGNDHATTQPAYRPHAP